MGGPTNGAHLPGAINDPGDDDSQQPDRQAPHFGSPAHAFDASSTVASSPSFDPSAPPPFPAPSSPTPSATPLGYDVAHNEDEEYDLYDNSKVSSNKQLSAAYLQEDMKLYMDHSHNKLYKKLAKRGAIPGIIDLSTGKQAKRMRIAQVYHGDRDQVLKGLLETCKTGKFSARIEGEEESVLGPTPRPSARIEGEEESDLGTTPVLAPGSRGRRKATSAPPLS
ncbi:hypothetical protein TrRE_jg7074 [Triparma retinervis]|uniref:Uncharacterized protein n=1 Tax=Triparma retinervis TaxID=2557542 RepID=A0A9W7L6L1_9STRA|nr:hypothetical protein TrRE_jg7074 [Triparma retinervis]